MTMNYEQELLRVFDEYKYSKDEIAIYLMHKYNDAITNQDNELASTIEKMMESLDIGAIQKQIRKPLE